MLSKDYNLKVIDFGDAKRADDFSSNTLNTLGSTSDDRRGTFVGTLNYIAPEVILEEEHGLGIDIWAAGNLLFKMLSGTVPFKGTNQHKVFQDIKQRNI